MIQLLIYCIKKLFVWNICLHKWTVWSDFIVTKKGAAVQDRHCKKCNKYELRWL